MTGSPGKLNSVVPSVKKSMYFEPTTCARFSAGFPLAWLTEEVADTALTVVVALSVAGATEVEVAVVDASVVAAMADEGDELAVSGKSIPGSTLVGVALVDVAVKAATMPVLKVPIIMTLIKRILAVENAITLFFIPS
jgi:hypothetical protein